jgi:hypothetical protein
VLIEAGHEVALCGHHRVTGGLLGGPNSRHPRIISKVWRDARSHEKVSRPFGNAPSCGRVADTTLCKGMPLCRDENHLYPTAHELLGGVPMPWTIECRHDHVAVVTMNTNKVNAQNPAFFDDLHAAFDRLEGDASSPARPHALGLCRVRVMFARGADLQYWRSHYH